MRDKIKNKLKAIGGNNLQIKESSKSLEKKKGNKNEFSNE